MTDNNDRKRSFESVIEGTNLLERNGQISNISQQSIALNRSPDINIDDILSDMPFTADMQRFMRQTDSPTSVAHSQNINPMETIPRHRHEREISTAVSLNTLPTTEHHAEVDADIPNDISANGNNSRIAHVKRPMNAFMVWAKDRRKELAEKDPKMHNSELSKILGSEWREMNGERKNDYIERANYLREEHSRNHPDYKYRPRRRSARGNRRGQQVQVGSNGTAQPSLNSNLNTHVAGPTMIMNEAIFNRLLQDPAFCHFNVNPPNYVPTQMNQHPAGYSIQGNINQANRSYMNNSNIYNYPNGAPDQQQSMMITAPTPANIPIPHSRANNFNNLQQQMLANQQVANTNQRYPMNANGNYNMYDFHPISALPAVAQQQGNELHSQQRQNSANNNYYMPPNINTINNQINPASFSNPRPRFEYIFSNPIHQSNATRPVFAPQHVYSNSSATRLPGGYMLEPNAQRATISHVLPTSVEVPRNIIHRENQFRNDANNPMNGNGRVPQRPF